MKDEFKINFHKIVMIIIIFHISTFARANTNDYINLESIKNQALQNAKQYEKNAQILVKNSEVAKNNSGIDKTWFLHKQQELLKSAYLNQAKPRENANKLVVFISFSMPQEAIKELLIQSSQYDSVLVIQGLVDNSFPKTINTITNLINKAGQRGGVTIEPNLFENYKIHSVPAFVINHEDTVDSDFDVVYGASGIKHALEIMSNSNTKSKAIAQRILQNA